MSKPKQARPLRLREYEAAIAALKGVASENGK